MQFVAFQTFFFFPNKNEKFSHNEIEQCDIIEIKRNRCKSLRKGEKKKKEYKSSIQRSTITQTLCDFNSPVLLEEV